MRSLTARLFGGLELRHGSSPPFVFPTRRSRSVFAFLALHKGRFFARDYLSGVIWERSSEESARKGLRTELWRIRKVLDRTPVDESGVLLCEGASVGIPRSAPLRVDVHAFEGWTRRPVPPQGGRSDTGEGRRLERAARLYRGDFLEGMYDPWCCEERERLRLEFLSVLERLMVRHQRREHWRRAIARGTQILRTDPLREHVHRALMRCHYAMGNRPASIRQYRECERVLREELDIGPMDETRSLLALMEAGHPLPDSTTPKGMPPVPPAPPPRTPGWRSLR